MAPDPIPPGRRTLEDRPAVSVIMPVRDEGVLVARAVRSVMAQDFAGGIEILLVDDASRDGTAAAAAAEAARHPRPDATLRVIALATSGGNAGAFAAGLAAARGRFWHVLDGDDYWIDPAKLARQVAALDADPALSAVAHRALVRDEIDGTETVHPDADPAQHAIDLEDILLGGVYVHTSSVLFRNLWWDAGAGRTRVPAIFHTVRGDLVRLCVQAKAGPIGFLPVTMSVYDDHRAGIWTGLDRRGRAALTARLFERLGAEGFLDGIADRLAGDAVARRLAAAAAGRPLTLRPAGLPARPPLPPGARPQRVEEAGGWSSLAALEAAVDAAAMGGEGGEALDLMRRFLTALAAEPTLARLARTRRLTAPTLDARAAALAAPPSPRRGAGSGGTLIAVSHRGPDAGGLRAEVFDLIALLQARGEVVSIVSTEADPGADPAGLMPADPTSGWEAETADWPLPVAACPVWAVQARAAWLAAEIAGRAPARLLLAPAAGDVAMLAGVAPGCAPQVIRLAAPGAGLAIGRHHPALTAAIARRPWDAAHLAQVAPAVPVVLIPWFRREPPPPPPDPVAAGLIPGRLVTITAAADRTGIEAAYDHGLDRVIVALLAGGAARHIHAGPLSAAMRNRIAKALARAGLPQAACRVIPLADLPALLAAAGASGGGLFLQGFPHPEPRLMAEAMAAGVPVVTHDSYVHPMLSLADMAHPGAPSWRVPGDLAAIVGQADAGWLADRAAKARLFAARLASPAALAAALPPDPFAAPQPVVAPPYPPARVPEGPEELRRFIAEVTAFTVLAP